MRKIQEFTNDQSATVTHYAGEDGVKYQTKGDVRCAKVYRDAEWNEYRVKFFTNGFHQSRADYHTDDKQDAIDTAKYMIGLKP